MVNDYFVNLRKPIKDFPYNFYWHVLAILSNCRQQPQELIGYTFNQSPLPGSDAASSLALSTRIVTPSCRICLLFWIDSLSQDDCSVALGSVGTVPLKSSSHFIPISTLRTPSPPQHIGWLAWIQARSLISKLMIDERPVRKSASNCAREGWTQQGEERKTFKNLGLL